MVAGGFEVAPFQPTAAGAGHRRGEQADAGEAAQPDNQVQVFRTAMGKTAHCHKQAPLHKQGLIAIGQTQEAAPPVGPPGDQPEERGRRGQAYFKSPGADLRVPDGPAQDFHMSRGQAGIDMQEQEQLAPGQAGPGVQLGSPAPGRGQPADMGETGRHFPATVGAAPIHQDNFQVRGPGEA